MTTKKKIKLNWEPVPESPVALSFTVNQRQYDKFMTWYKDVSRRAAQKQYQEAKERNFEGAFDDIVKEDSEYPYTGAIGGDVSWDFAQTSFGVAVKARYFTGDEIDLTEYDSW